MPLSLAIDDATTVASKKLPQYLIVIFVTIEAFSIGTYLAWTSPALPLYAERGGGPRIGWQEASWICSLVPLGAVFGTLPAGLVADRIGRKRTILLTTVPLLLCWFLIAFSNGKIWIFLARLLGGIACGAASVVIPMYVSEIAEDSIRGSLGTIFQLQITIGILFTYATGFAEDLRTINLLCAIAPALLLAGLPFLPESPAWLVMHDRTSDADYAIKRLRGEHYRTEDEIARLVRYRDTQGASAGLPELKHYLKATIITLGLMIFQQLSGVNTLIFYAESIFKQAGSSLSSTVCSVVVGVVQVAATYFSTILIDRAGRKILLFVSASVMAVCMFVLSGYFHFQNTHDVSNVNWLPLLSFTIFIVIFSVGFGPIPWLMVGELFTQNVKGVASSATAICNWILAFFVTKCFQDMVDLMGISSSFAIFGMIGLMGTAFVAVMVPETKGKTIEQVQIELYGRKDGRSRNTLSRS